MICFNEQTLLFSSLFTIIICIVIYKYIYDIISKVFNKENMIVSTPITQTTPVSRLQDIYTQSESSRLYNPIAPPARRYDQEGNDYNVVGYIFNTSSNERYALFGRNHDASRSDRKDYYIIDDKSTRFNIKIPVETRNYTELFDGDTVYVDTLGKEYTVKIYPVDQYVYNPNV